MKGSSGIGRVFLFLICVPCASAVAALHILMPKIGPRGNLAIGLALGVALSIAIIASLPKLHLPGRTWFALASLVATGLALRLHMLALARLTSLYPDAQTYRRQALEGGLLSIWDGKTWTPLWVWYVRVWYRLFGDAEIVQRCASVSLSLALIAMTFFAARRVMDTKGALVGAASVALSPQLASGSVHGLREEIGMLLLLGLVWALKAPKVSMRAALVAGGVLGLMALTRTEFLAISSVVLILSLLRPRRERVILTASALGLAALLAIPQSLLVLGYWGRADYWVTTFTRGWVNIEYQAGKLTEEQFGRSGDGSEPLPTKQELQTDIFAGPPIGPSGWFFKVHTPKETMRRTIKGVGWLPLFTFREAVWAPQTGVSFFDYGPRFQEPFLTATSIGAGLSLLGILILAIRKHWQILLMTLGLAATYAIPFTIEKIRYKKDPIVFDMRLAAVLIPFLAIGLGSVMHLLIPRRWKDRPHEREVSLPAGTAAEDG